MQISRRGAGLQVSVQQLHRRVVPQHHPPHRPPLVTQQVRNSDLYRNLHVFKGLS